VTDRAFEFPALSGSNSQREHATPLSRRLFVLARRLAGQKKIELVPHLLRADQDGNRKELKNDHALKIAPLGENCCPNRITTCTVERGSPLVLRGVAGRSLWRRCYHGAYGGGLLRIGGIPVARDTTRWRRPLWRVRRNGQLENYRAGLRRPGTQWPQLGVMAQGYGVDRSVAPTWDYGTIVSGCDEIKLSAHKNIGLPVRTDAPHGQS